MKRIDRLIHGLEDCGFTHEEAVRLVEVKQRHMLREVVTKKVIEKVRKMQ